MNHKSHERNSGADEWVDRPLDRTSEELREVCARAGLALWTAETLQHGIVNLLVAIEQNERLRNRITKSATIREQLDKLWSDNFRLTMGQIMKRARSVVTLDEDLSDNLEQSLAARNRLAHGFFRERAVTLQNSEGRQAAAYELTRMRELFLFTDRKLQKIYDQMWKKLKIPREAIERMAPNLRELATKGASASEIRKEVEKAIAELRCSAARAQKD